MTNSLNSTIYFKKENLKKECCKITS